MKGVFQPEVVRAAAEAAVQYWTHAFEFRKKAWIKSTAEREYGILWWRKKVGVELAERCFSAGFMSNLPFTECGGTFWSERDNLDTAETLVGLTERGGADHFILSAAEIAALSPVLPELTQ